VWYLHQKKIVHRDLKLENLLLDRHRNVIVTDFGFANRFEHKTDDLMQTSCGSPCYAAPELVISEGLYVGSAVDIWSCGVILYAMLAGYLPFDDDPANPEGDNINLLYKYILSTQLTFPDYVSTEARDLLSKMLVPDPQHRADLQTVMSHEWLSPYASLFGRSIEEYENVAHEQQMQKRANYQRQIREREREIQRAIKAQQKEQQRQHAHPDPRSTKSTGAYAGQVSMEVEDSFVVPTPAPNRRAVASAIILPTSPDPMEDLVMTGPAIVESQRNQDERARKESRTSERRSGKGKEVDHREKKGAGPSSKGGRPPPGGFRHTIQLEYDGGGDQAEAMPPAPSRATGKRRHDDDDIVMRNAESPSRSRRESSVPRPSQAAAPVPPVPPPMQTPQSQASHSPPHTAGISTLPALIRNAATEPAVSTYKPTNESQASLPTPPAGVVINTGVPVPTPTTPLQSPVADSPVASTTSTPSSTGNKPSKHGRGMSIDRFNISKLLHGKDSSGEEKKEKEESKKRPSRKGSETSSNAGAGMAGIGAGGGIPTPPTSAALTSRSNLSVGSGGASGTTAPSTSMDQTSVGKGSSKRRGGKALSLVVDPITRYVAPMLSNEEERVLMPLGITG
jgi:protein-serine/threonine kinase